MFGQMKPPLGTQINFSHPLSRGLVACFLMNESSGNRVSDLSGNNNQGTFVNHTKWVPGRSGPALSFDGADDSVNLGRQPTLTLNRDFSGFAWIRLIGTTGDRAIICAGSNEWYLRVDNTTNKLNFIDAEVAAILNGNTALAVNSWYHVGFTVTFGGTLTLWVNGNSDGSKDITNTLNNGSSNRSIGSQNNVSEIFSGLIDEVRIYNRVLSAQEIWQLYASPYAMFEREPYWMRYVAAGGLSIPVVTETLSFTEALD